MKKRLGFTISGFVLSLLMGLGVSKPVQKASACDGLEGPTIHAELDSSHLITYEQNTSPTSQVTVSNAFCNRYADLTESQLAIAFDVANAKYYQQSGSDLATLDTSLLEPVPNGNGVYTIENEGDLYVLKEDSPNQLFNMILIPLRFSLQVSANETVSYSSLHITLTIRKIATNGTSGAFVELFEGFPEIMNTSSNDNPSQSHGLLRKHVTSGSNNISNRVMVECDLFGESFVNNTNEAMTIYSSHTYYLLLGCRYGSNYTHQAEATAYISGTKGNVITDYQCRIGTTYYETLADGLANGSTTANQPLYLLTDLTSSNASFPLVVSKRTYLNLNGYTINGGNNVALCATGGALDLYGSGTIVSSAIHTVESTQTIVMTQGSNITIRNEYVGDDVSAAYYQTANYLTMWGGTIAGGDYGIYFAANTLYINGGTVTGNLYDLYTTRGVNLSGSTTSVEDIYIPVFNSMIVRLNSGNAYYTNTNSQINITYSDGSDITTEKTMVDNIYSEDIFNLITINNGVSTGLEFYYDATGKKYVTRYISRTLTFNGTNCSLSSTSKINYGNQYNGSIIPDTAYTYPSSIEILMNGTPLAANQYTYNSNTGNFSIYKNVILDDIVVNAVAEIAHYTITFSSNGGSGTMSNMSGVYNDVIILPSCSFTRNNRTFLEWNTKSNGTGDSYQPGDDYVVTASVSLYAIWYESNENKVDQFVANYMKLTTYTTNQGLCLGENGYYAQAKAALIALGEDCIALFVEADKYNDAQERYEMWAYFNNDVENMYNDTPVNSSANITSVELASNNTVAIVLSIVGLLTTLSFCFYFKMKKSK